jgi:hypothetical protein
MSDGQEVKEEIRKEVRFKLDDHIRTSPTSKIGRFVDGQELEKCVVSQYAQYNNNLRKVANEQDDIEKNRGRYGSGYHPAEIELNRPFEQIYFELMGHGYNGSPFPNRIGELYVCRCGLKYETSHKLAPERCPICGTLTPRGELNQYFPNWYKK